MGSQEKLLVTGSSGMIGTALCRRLANRGYDITGVDTTEPRPHSGGDYKFLNININNKELKNLSPNFDLIIHLAAHARVHELVNNPYLAKENIDMTIDILEYARDTNTDVVFASSREVYGNDDSIIKTEDDTYADVCESPYTASKISGEAFVESYSNCYDIDTSIVRFSNVYGKYDDSDRVVPLFISLAKNGDDLIVYGEEKVLDFTYITDCIDGIEKVIEDYGKGKNNTFNIASGMGRSLVELANLVKDKTNSSSNIVIEKSRTGEVQQYVADISRANKILNYSPDISLDEGLDKTIEWYNNNPHLLEDLK